MDETLYVKRQTGWVIIFTVAALLAVTLALPGHRLAGPPLVIPVAVLGLVAVVFSSMTVCVTRTDVKWWLDFGLLKGRIALSDIASVQIETVPFYRGYGIRTNGRTHIWRINGLKCVVLARRNGAKVILGAADPNRLIAAIEHARGESHPTG